MTQIRSVNGDKWENGGEESGSRRAKWDIGPLAGNIQAQVLWVLPLGTELDLLAAGAPILNSHFKSTPIGGLRWPRPVQKWFYSFCNKWNNTDTPVRASCLSFIARSPCRHAAFGFYGMYSCRSDFWFCLVFALMYCLISLLMQCVGMYLCRPEAGDESNCGRRTGLSNKEEVGMHLLMCVHSYYSRVFVCITCTLVKVVRCIWLYI